MGREITFAEKVYALCKKIPCRRVSTYKLIAERLGVKAYRAVGNALNKNPYKTVPCHRVVKTNGFVGGFARGINAKIKLLKKEGIKIENKKIKLEKYLFRF